MIIYPHANEIREDAKKQRSGRGRLTTIYNRARKASCYQFYGDYIVARMVVEGCLDVGKVKADEFFDSLSKLRKTGDETRESLLEEFGKACGICETF